MARRTQQEPKVITIKPLDLRTMKLRLVGDTPLLCNRRSLERLSYLEEDPDTRERQGVRAAERDLEKDYQDSLYRLDDGSYGFPSDGLKQAVVSAARFVDKVKMTSVRGWFQIMEGDLVKIDGHPRPRSDIGRNSGLSKSPRLIVRAEFPPPWSATVTIRYNADTVAPETIVRLLSIAGFGVGIGDWRPEKGGNFGMFRVEADAMEAAA